MKRKSFIIKNVTPSTISKTTSLMAGAAKTDITPPPGMPMSGHSKNARFGMGVRTRLYARAIYLKPKNGRPVALITCDLLSGSLVLHHRVAELVAAGTDLEAASILIAGTHTHSGPGNYFGSEFYNRFASNVAGFDDVFFEFLAGRIADAVMAACKNSQPARIGVGATEVWNATRNRSILAHRKNPGAQERSIYEAVNHLLHMIRIDCQDKNGLWLPLAAFSNFSIHPNLSNFDTDCLYHGDLVAYIEREVEWGIRRMYKTPWEIIHAAANFTHGDCTPDFRKDVELGFIEDRRIGTAVGKKALDLFQSLETVMRSDVAIRYFAREIDVFSERSINDITISGRPAVGNALIAGAQDRGRSTPVMRSLPFFKPGWPRWFFTGGSQGRKRIFGGPLQRLIVPKGGFPHILFLQSIQIGSSVLLPLPFEITCESGMRIAAAASQEAERAGLKGTERFIVVSCANDYWGYTATQEEYSRQHYEGGHTLYGQNTCAFLAAHAARTVRDMALHEYGSELPSGWNFELPVKRFSPKSLTFQENRSIELEPVFQAAEGKHEACWRFRWYDAGPSRIELHNPLVRIEASTNGSPWKSFEVDGMPADDSGYDLAVLLVEINAKNRTALYEARWYNPPEMVGVRYRFVILPRDRGELLYSGAFS
jgi:neutral ceramidase